VLTQQEVLQQVLAQEDEVQQVLAQKVQEVYHLRNHGDSDG
jgi:hypothetical protein